MMMMMRVRSLKRRSGSDDLATVDRGKCSTGRSLTHGSSPSMLCAHRFLASDFLSKLHDTAYRQKYISIYELF